MSRREKLDQIAECNNARIIDIVPVSSGLKQPRVIFYCFCGEQYSKQVNDVCGKKSTGLFCYIHTLEQKRRVKLLTAIKESALIDNATFSEDEIVWGRESCLKFICFCGKENTKTLWGIRKNQGMFCKEHTAEKTRQKAKDTSILHYGTDHPQQSTQLKEIIRENCIKKYGVEYIAHVPEIHAKQHNFKFKDYLMPSGDVRKVQGYESIALDELIKKYPEEIISTTRIGLTYTFENNEHYYYPDIILKTNPEKIIEVKSTHTMYYKTHYLKNLAKREGCISKGYDFEFWVYDKDLNKTVI